MDVNGNGYLSLAEVDKGIRDVLRCQQLFDAKPAIMRAFQAAKHAVKTKSRLGADYVERMEFRLLLVYLRKYFELFQLFRDVDTSGDRRISPKEFSSAAHLLNKWGCHISSQKEADAIFTQVDLNDGGFILFDEFSQWLLNTKIMPQEAEALQHDVEFEHGTNSKPSIFNASFSLPVDWSGMASALPTEMSSDDKAKRAKLFDGMDVNGNGYLSLAEVDKGVRDVLNCQQIFDAKPAMMRAFQAAKGAAQTKARLGPDFVERCEFRLLLVYLKKYFELFSLFKSIDTSSDRRINLQEFKAALPKMEAWGLKVTSAAEEFKNIDSNGGGVLLFDEFSKWALEQRLRRENASHE